MLETVPAPPMYLCETAPVGEFQGSHTIVHVIISNPRQMSISYSTLYTVCMWCTCVRACKTCRKVIWPH